MDSKAHRLVKKVHRLAVEHMICCEKIACLEHEVAELKHAGSDEYLRGYQSGFDVGLEAAKVHYQTSLSSSTMPEVHLNEMASLSDTDRERLLEEVEDVEMMNKLWRL
ncbi:MAG: hypothetical protein V3V61_01060 [Gammaproteobacteria bacterium]